MGCYLALLFDVLHDQDEFFQVEVAFVIGVQLFDELLDSFSLPASCIGCAEEVLGCDEALVFDIKSPEDLGEDVLAGKLLNHVDA